MPRCASSIPSCQIINALQQGANDYIVKPINPAVADARIKMQLTLKHYTALKDDAVRFASHDLKKPLLLMQDMLAELQQELHKPAAAIDECRVLGELLQKTVTQMDNVVHGFLHQNTLLAQKDIRDNIDLNQLTLDIVQANQPYAAQKQIRIETQLAADLPKLQTNGFALRQIIENLLGNALKFSPAGSHTTLLTEFTDNSVKLHIKPTGNETSSGIGLVLCKEFIEQMGGAIGAYNNPDRGVTFWISLPTGTL